MSTFTRIEEEKFRERLEARKCLSNFVPEDSMIASFETFIPGQIIFDEDIIQERQQSLYFQEQFPQTNSATPNSNSPLSIFIAHTYNDVKLTRKIEQILQTIAYQEQNINYQFGEIALDTRWEKSRHDYLASVDLILLLVTQAFIATKYCYSEQLRWAILRHSEERSYVIPILLQACLWDGTPFAGLYTITPNNLKAVDEWPKAGLALNAIASDIRYAVRGIRKGR